MSSETWRELVDLDQLAAWMDGEALGRGLIENPTPLTGGTQNVLLRFQRDGRPYVLRRSPRHPRGDGNVTNRREARVLGALAGTDVPHPLLIAACSSEHVIGAAFYLMEPVALLESYHDYKEWPGPSGIPGIAEVADWLARHIPPRFTPGLLHGDYHLANVMFRNDGPQLAAIVDWELATIGDPLLDMGWIMATWPDREGHTTSEIGITPWTGFPEIEELIAYYAAGSPRDTSQMRWYGVLACYKLGLILEGTHARACAGLASKATGDRLHKSCVKLFQRALGWLDDDRFALI